MSTSDRPSAQAEEMASFTRLSDEAWEAATTRIEKAVDRYQHVDFGKLAEGVVDQYIKSLAEMKAAERLPLGFPVTGMATAATGGMVSALVGAHSDRGRFRAAYMSGFGFLGPLMALLAIVYAWHSKVGWYGISRGTLVTVFALFLAISLTMIVSFVRGGALVQLLTKQGALAVSIGALAATIVSPLAIRELRSSESDRLALASGDLSSYVADAMNSPDSRSPIRRVALMAESRESYDLLDEKVQSNTAVSIYARGLPGHLTAKVDSPESARVTWSQPFRSEVTRALIKQGRVEAALTGGALLVTRDGSYSVSESLYKAVPSPRNEVVGLIDARTSMVTRVLPAPPSRAASATGYGSPTLVR